MTSRRWSRIQTTTAGPERCVSCDYDLRGIAVGGRCPECGTVVPTPPAQAAVDRGRPDHRDSGLHVVATCQYLALVPMSGLMLLGCFGSTIGVVSVFGPIARIVSLASPWKASPLRSIEPAGFGRLLFRLACAEAVFGAVFVTVVLGLLPVEALLPSSMAYALMSVVSVVTTNLRLERIFSSWEFALPAVLSRLGFIAGCLAGVSTVAVITVRIAAPGPDIVSIVTLLGVLLGVVTSLLAVFATRDGIERVETVLITDLIETHAESVDREPTPLDERFRTAPTADPLPLEPERPPVREDLD